MPSNNSPEKYIPILLKSGQKSRGCFNPAAFVFGTEVFRDPMSDHLGEIKRIVQNRIDCSLPDTQGRP